MLYMTLKNSRNLWQAYCLVRTRERTTMIQLALSRVAR